MTSRVYNQTLQAEVSLESVGEPEGEIGRIIDQ